jgi:hypothetical protein
MNKLSINESQVDKLIALLNLSHVPRELEASTHSFKWTRGLEDLANAYFAIVAICHQTSPIGERALQGYVDGETQKKVGWDYLKERFLIAAIKEPKWTSQDFWKTLTPGDLSALYFDERLAEECGDHSTGKTFSRLNERAFLINDLGNQMTELGMQHISEGFIQREGRIGGESGFMNFLRRFEAYKDPVSKKSLFFLSIVANECGWAIQDREQLLSPVDYHELRGHLRVGTLTPIDAKLSEKIQRGVAFTEEEDTQLRLTAQEINNKIGKETGLGSSVVHYLFWNIFRNCCPRDSEQTHCSECGERCKLPEQYKKMPTYGDRCVFSDVCFSANNEAKVIEPPYVGHFY